jgi:hypothetical protein
MQLLEEDDPNLVTCFEVGSSSENLPGIHAAYIPRIYGSIMARRMVPLVRKDPRPLPTAHEGCKTFMRLEASISYNFLG